MAIYKSRQKGSGTATSITPSNVSPVALVADSAVKPTAAGYAIASYNNVTPSNSSPATLTSGDIDKMGGNGYAIQSYSNVTPSSTPASVSSGDIVKIGGSGVIVNSVPTPTSITPSNTSPASMTSGGLYRPTANGAAISSYTSVTPSSTPASVSSGDIVKIGGSGVIVNAVPTPTSITPSDTSPASMTSGGLYQPTDNGYAIEDYTAIEPSNASPAVLVKNHMYQIQTNNGVAVQTLDNIAPSNSGQAMTSGYIYKALANGFVYPSRLPNIFAPNVQTVIASSTGGTTAIAVSQKPKYIVLATWNAAGNQYGGMLGVVDVANSTAKRLGYSSSGTISWGDWSGYTGYFTSITASSVTYKSNWSTNTATRSMILIYY